MHCGNQAIPISDPTRSDQTSARGTNNVGEETDHRVLCATGPVRWGNGLHLKPPGPGLAGGEGPLLSLARNTSGRALASDMVNFNGLCEPAQEAVRRGCPWVWGRQWSSLTPQLRSTSPRRLSASTERLSSGFLTLHASLPTPLSLRAFWCRQNRDFSRVGTTP